MSVRLAVLSPAVFEALADGDRVAGEQLTGLSMTPWFADRIDIWQYMLTLLEGRPENADWLMQAIVLDTGDVIGNAGFKGAPVGGEVELGYSIAPEHRRRGHASAAVELLVGRARREPLVEQVVARIAPDNGASVGVVTKAGFVPREDWNHPRWGRQLQFVRCTPTPVE
jgi:ribosomal-protein-alanine N-acetyltransferase